MNNLSIAEVHVAQNAKKWSDEERKIRIDLAAAYRMAAMLGWNELIFNHFTARIPGTDHILLNPFGLGFEEITASSLIKVDLDGNIIEFGSTEHGINVTGYVIHGAIHRSRPEIYATMHIHNTAGVAVSSMKCGLLENLCQNSMICGEVAYHDYEGISVEMDEQKRIQADLGATAKNLILRNHGLLTLGATMQECFLHMFLLVKACEIQVMSMSAVGGDLSKLNYGDDKYKEQARVISSKSLTHNAYGVKEFEYLKRKLDKTDQSYRY
ncbi:alpha adducin [Heterostelium album PN500]|uniref:Alpha adducin n=1 Tax=Heterostelium pallidum (strain ATCC 26659 / Pp 5 / PN500) TaxID=670386 RepID=D3B2A6_HETP5|nr:alpha adducin [Heterostelium album PN500]EFA84481.1 alpha adducin [Heterostelium album PN500]|eukprot:XP_020436595.1 alpha adducin [Heterostelium album PN500]